MDRQTRRFTRTVVTATLAMLIAVFANGCAIVELSETTPAATTHSETDADETATRSYQMFKTISYETYSKVVYDTETGVMYVVSRSTYNYGNYTVMLDADGKPRIYERFGTDE